MKARVPDRLLKLFFHASSGHLPSRTMGKVADLPLPRPVLDRLIHAYCATYRIQLAEAEVPPGGFRTFDAFFTRKLRPGLRKVDLDPDVVASPSDGHVQSSGRVDCGTVLQAKGHDYPLQDLLGDEGLCRRFEGGPYVTVYLSPRDYHRVHFPVDGEVTWCRYTPGRLFTVQPKATELVAGLFPRNERITTLLRTPFGTVAVVMVGAVGVGRITVTHGGMASNVGQPGSAVAFDPARPCRKGDELGVFHLGSTVILILEPGPWQVLARPGAPVRMGEALLRRE